MLPALLGVLLLPAVAAAQPAEPADAASAVEVTIHGSARATGSDTDGTRVVEVTTEDDLRDAGNVQSLADSLRRRPGTSVQQTSPGQGTIYVRGLSGRAVLHVVDGVRLNSTFFRAGNNPYLGLVDVHALESIGVVGGASSLLYGSDGLAGAVFMQSRLPGYHYAGDLRALRVDQTLTSNPWAYTTRLGAEAASEQWAVAGGYTVSAAGAIRPGDGTRTPVPSSYVGLEREPGAPYRPAMSQREQGTESTFQAGDVSVRRRLAREVELVLRGQAAELPHLVRYDEITPRFKLEYPSRAESSVEALYRVMASATLAHRPRHLVYDELQAQLSYQRLHEAPRRRSFDELCLGEEDESGCAGLRQLRPAAERLLEENASDAVGGRVVARFGVDPGRMGLVGVDVHHDVVTSRASSLEVGSGERTESASRYPSGSSQTQAGAFASVTQTPIDGVTVHGGLRGSLFGLDIRPRAATETEAPTAGVSDLSPELTGALGARVRLVDGVAWLVNGGRGVRAPNVQDLAAVGTRSKGTFQVAKLELAPEHSYTGDTGFDVDFHRWSARTVLFLVEHRDAIVLGPTTVDGASVAPDGSLYVHSINAATVRVHGAEGSIDAEVLPRVTLWLRWLLMLGLQRNPAGTEAPRETYADRIPPHQGELGLWYEPTRWRLGAFLAARERQDRLNDPINTGDNRIPAEGTPGFLTLHLWAMLRATDEIRIRLALDNVTNQLVLEHGNGFYGAGFSGTLGAEVVLR